MENLQTHINPITRAHCVDKLVSDARRLNYVPATLYLAVNYLDRYLSCNLVENEDELRLVGLTCMMLASKYEEAQLFDLSDYMDVVAAGKIARSDLVRMECVVLNQLKHELSVPTAWTFLEMFVTAEAFGTKHEPSSDLKSKSSCIAEISLLSYRMLRFQPSLVAAASVFLALYTIEPNKFPWTAALQLYTIYRPSDLCDCVEMLHQFLHKSMNSDTLSISKKYRREKAAWKDFPTLLHPEIFNDLAD